MIHVYTGREDRTSRYQDQQPEVELGRVRQSKVRPKSLILQSSQFRLSERQRQVNPKSSPEPRSSQVKTGYSKVKSKGESLYQQYPKVPRFTSLLSQDRQVQGHVQTQARQAVPQSTLRSKSIHPKIYKFTKLRQTSPGSLSKSRQQVSGHRKCHSPSIYPY